ncbi:hypothetical protein HMPREF1219_01292 [Corynebacterium pyruviciproducens ATCC BAA-1742]|uniref:Uncharacterized protein n=1 Tax=Corynebacterium pyruviciproducens ATCC BAA-1742 TaxID=1125779 RepID=S2Z5A7_9CORY|nr:hypothetical protein HMPREF1219_01292 [Corynebacterium pyruviciproducens ATCC BAA-1742]
MVVEDRPEGARIVRHWNERGRAAMLDLVIIIVMVVTFIFPSILTEVMGSSKR